MSDWQLIKCSRCNLEAVRGFESYLLFVLVSRVLIQATAMPTFLSSALSILLPTRLDRAAYSQNGSVNTVFNPMEMGGGPPR